MLGLLAELKGNQAQVLDQVIAGKLVTVSTLTEAGVLTVDPADRKFSATPVPKQVAAQHSFDV